MARQCLGAAGIAAATVWFNGEGWSLVLSTALSLQISSRVKPSNFSKASIGGEFLAWAGGAVGNHLCFAP